MKESVYIETSIIGYLTARPTGDLITQTNIGITQEWWNFRRSAFDLYASEAVLEETSRGDEEIAKQRLVLLRDFPLLKLNEAVQSLAIQLLSKSNLPDKASVDALHIAAATVHGMDYLLTWNCKHIANAQIQRKLTEISRNSGYVLPILCTPNELMGG